MRRKEVIGVNGEKVDIAYFQPIGEYAKSLTDKELIEEISLFEARQQFYKYTINGATIALYDSMIKEWEKRYSKKHIPRIAYTRDQVYKHFDFDIGT
jgi:hypothetical protein